MRIPDHYEPEAAAKLFAQVLQLSLSLFATRHISVNYCLPARIKSLSD